jgi:hypothetical protein
VEGEDAGWEAVGSARSTLSRRHLAQTRHRLLPPADAASSHSCAQYTGPVSGPEYMDHLPKAVNYRAVAPA